MRKVTRMIRRAPIRSSLVTVSTSDGRAMVQENAGTAAGEDPSIRMATPDDAEALLAIYAPYVRDTAITFEWDVPSVEEFRARIAHTLERYPYLVAESAGGRALGYAYAGPLKERKAYDWACELSIDRKSVV